MMPPPRERDLVRNLVTTWHQTGSEYKGIPGGIVRGSLIYETIEEVLQAEGRFPVNWQPDDSFAGGLIEALKDGGYRVTWKAEFALMHHDAVSVKEYGNRREAVVAFARRFFGGDIDGIPIDWSA
jgi:hypothetical protein